MRDESDRAQDCYQAGMTAFRRGIITQAAELLRQAIGLAPENAVYRAHAAEIFRRAGWLSEALAAGRDAARLQPDLPAAHNNYGLALLDSGQIAEAEASFRQAARIDSNYAKAWHNLGNALRLQHRLNEAAAALQRALEIRPDYPQALNGLGLVLKQLHQLNRAVDLFQQALKLRPNYPQALLNLANTLGELGQGEEAERLLRRVLQLRPQYAQAWHDLGALLERNHRLGDACEAYRQSHQLDSASAELLAALENAKRRCCDWSDRPQRIERLLSIVRDTVARGAPSPLWPLASLRFPTTSADRLAIARAYARTIGANIGAGEPGKQDPVDGGKTTAETVSPSTSSRLRVGFLSHEFGHNVVSHLMAGLYGRFDRQRFEIVALDYSQNDNSQLRSRVLGDCGQCVELRGLTPGEAAQRISAEQVNILFDINSYMPGGRPEIAAHCPAPIQVSYMYPASMGAEWIDYFLTDHFATPAGQEPYFTEKLVYLPDAYLPTNCDQLISESGLSRAECGLPDEGFVFCSFNNADKIEPELFDVWMRILKRVPGSVLWQRCDDQIIQDNLSAEANARGVAPERLIYARQLSSTADHLARHRQAGLFLDTYTHGGHGTAVDALWAGLPLLACPGEVFTSRVSVSLLTAAGLPELIASDLHEYEARAVRLAEHPAELKAIREKLQANRREGSLFDTTRYVRNLERALLEMWRIHQAGESPRPIDVAALVEQVAHAERESTPDLG